MLLVAPEELTPSRVLKRLSDAGMGQVLLEGGPTLNYAFFAADLVDRFYLTLVPYVIGQAGLPGPVQGSAALSGFDRVGWELVRHEAIGSEVFLEYSRRRQ